MLRGAPRGKDAQRRLRKSVRRTRASSTDRRTQTSSAAGQGGEGRTFSINPTKNPSTLVSEAKRVAKEQCNLQGDTNAEASLGKESKVDIR